MTTGLERERCDSRNGPSLYCGKIRRVRLSSELRSVSPVRANYIFRLIRYPFAVFIVSEMLELCREHASFRFVVAEEGTNARRLLVSACISLADQS